ncbi:MAG: hypothetical protein GX593_13945 [Actinomycetales bacterium]|nr:hypothetical protein [Actinomycetales bacterium]
MTERSIVEAAARLRRHGEPYLVASVVATHGEPLRRVGARMLLTRFRWVAGTVCGGVLEGDLSNSAWRRTRDAPVLVRYDAASSALVDDEDIRSVFGLGGDGVVEVLLERGALPGHIDALEVASRCQRTQRPAVIATVFRSESPTVRPGARLAQLAGGALEEEAEPLDARVQVAIAADLAIALETGSSRPRAYVTPDGAVEALIEYITPPPRLFLFGTGHDAVPVAQLARQLGWEVIVCPAHTRFSTRERFAMADEVLSDTLREVGARIEASYRPLAVVMNHDAAFDAQVLALLLATRTQHIAALAPRSRALDPRVHVIEHGDAPPETALAILASARAALEPAVAPRDPAPRPSPRTPTPTLAATVG